MRRFVWLGVGLLGCRDGTETQVAALQADVEALQEEVALLRAERDADAVALAEVDADVAGLGDEIDLLAAEVDAVTGGVDLTGIEADLADHEARVSALEGEDFATETWVETRGYASTAVVQVLAEGLSGAVASTAAVATTVGANTAAIADLSASVTTNAQSIGTLQSAVTGFDARITANGTAIAGLEGDLAQVGADVDAAEQARAALQDDLDGVAQDLADARVDVTALGGSIDDLGGSVTALGDDLDALAATVASSSGDVGGLADDVDALGQSVADVSAAVDAFDLELDAHAAAIDTVYALVQDQTDQLGDLELTDTLHMARWTTAYDMDAGIVPERSLTFTKERAETAIFVVYDDNVRIAGANNACQWEVLINGQSCTSPGPLVHMVYQSNQNQHRPTQIIGTCTATGAGPLGQGAVSLSLRVSTAPGYSGADCYTGWNGSPGHFIAREVFE